MERCSSLTIVVDQRHRLPVQVGDTVHMVACLRHDCLEIFTFFLFMSSFSPKHGLKPCYAYRTEKEKLRLLFTSRFERGLPSRPETRMVRSKERMATQPTSSRESGRVRTILVFVFVKTGWVFGYCLGRYRQHARGPVIFSKSR